MCPFPSPTHLSHFVLIVEFLKYSFHGGCFLIARDPLKHLNHSPYIDIFCLESRSRIYKANSVSIISMKEHHLLAILIMQRQKAENTHSFINSKGKYHVPSTSQKSNLTSFYGKILAILKDGHIWTVITVHWYTPLK